jgi:hypothetical protein
MAFWRRSKGRHALGAAVTSIPAAPVRPVAPSLGLPVEPAPVEPAPAEPAPLEPALAPPVWQPPAVVVPHQPAPDWSFPELHPAAATRVEVPPAGPRVELTFADGTSAALDPTQARALDEIAQVLTQRD